MLSKNSQTTPYGHLLLGPSSQVSFPLNCFAHGAFIDCLLVFGTTFGLRLKGAM